MNFDKLDSRSTGSLSLGSKATDCVEIGVAGSIVFAKIKPGDQKNSSYTYGVEDVLQDLRDSRWFSTIVLDLRDLKAMSKDMADALLSARDGTSMGPFCLVNEDSGTEAWLLKHPHGQLFELRYGEEEIFAELAKDASMIAVKSPSETIEMLQDRVRERELARAEFALRRPHPDPVDEEFAPSLGKPLLQQKIQNGVAVVEFCTSDLPESSWRSGRFLDEIREIASSCENGLVLDLSGVKKVGADSIGTIIATECELQRRGLPFVLCGLNETTKSKLTEMLGGHLDILELCDTQAEALSKFAR